MPRNASTFSRFHHPKDVPTAMADRSQPEIIKDNPIGNGLDTFRASFNLVCDGASISCTVDALDQLGQEGKKDVQLRPSVLL